MKVIDRNCYIPHFYSFYLINTMVYQLLSSKMRSRNNVDVNRCGNCQSDEYEYDTLSSPLNQSSTQSISISSSIDNEEKGIGINAIASPKNTPTNNKNNNCTNDQYSNNKDDCEKMKIPRIHHLSTSIMCATCLIINSVLSFFIVEKKRIWTQGHVLPLKCDLAELGFLISMFFSITGSVLACTTTDWIWFLPGCITMFLSSTVYLSVEEGCEGY